MVFQGGFLLHFLQEGQVKPVSASEWASQARAALRRGLQDDSGKGQHDAGERAGSLPNVFQMEHSPRFSQTDTSVG